MGTLIIQRYTSTIMGLEDVENSIPFIAGRKYHEWRKLIVASVFTILNAGFLLVFFPLTTVHTINGKSKPCYSNGAIPVDYENDNTTVNVSGNFEMLARFGSAICGLYIVVGLFAC